eukprot:6604281-Prymnesium_polylepis.2
MSIGENIAPAIVLAAVERPLWQDRVNRVVLLLKILDREDDGTCGTLPRIVSRAIVAGNIQRINDHDRAARLNRFVVPDSLLRSVNPDSLLRCVTVGASAAALQSSTGCPEPFEHRLLGVRVRGGHGRSV